MTRASDPDSATALLRLPELRALIAARGLAALGMPAITRIVAFQTDEITGEPLAFWREAATAWSRFGRGRHGAGLTFGDCLAYAVARSTSSPLLA